MVFSSVKKKQGVQGDLKYEIFDLTDVTTDSLSTVTAGFNVLFAGVTSNSAAPGVIKVVSVVGKVITLDAEVADDDGQLYVLGK